MNVCMRGCRYGTCIGSYVLVVHSSMDLGKWLDEMHDLGPCTLKCQDIV